MPAFYIPNGPRNLNALFPSVNFSDVEEYYVQLKDNAGNVVLSGTSNWMQRCAEDQVRLFFMNASGGIDALNARRLTAEADVKSERFIRAQSTSLAFNSGGTVKTNIKSGDIWKLAITDYPESANPWLRQLVESPFVWIADSSNNNYLPVIVLDLRFLLKKESERFDNTIELEIAFANETIIQRT